MTSRLRAWFAATITQQASSHDIEALDEFVHSPKGLMRVRIEPASIDDLREKDNAES